MRFLPTDSKYRRGIIVAICGVLVAFAVVSVLFFAWYNPAYQSTNAHKSSMSGKYYTYNSGILNAASVNRSDLSPDLYISDDLQLTNLRSDPLSTHSLEAVVLAPWNFEWLFRSQKLRPNGQQFSAADLREYRANAVASWRVKTEKGYTYYILLDGDERLYSISILTDSESWKSRYNQHVVISSYVLTPEEYLPVE